MPYRSARQRRFMHARHPEIAARWDAEEKRVSKSQPRYGDQGARGRRIVEDDLALEPVGKRDYNPEDRRQRRLGATSAALTIAAGGLGYKGVKGAAKTTSRLKALGIRGAVGAKDTTVGAKSRPFLAVDREAGMYLGGAGAAAGGALGLRQHAEKKRGRPWD